MKKIIITVGLIIVLFVILIINNIVTTNKYSINTNELNNNAYELYKLEKQIEVKKDKCEEIESSNQNKIEEINTWKNKVEDMKNNL